MELVTAAARRVAADIGAPGEAHATGMPAGPQADLRPPNITSRCCSSCGRRFPIAGCATSDPSPDRPDWWLLHDYRARRHAVWGPYEYVVADARRLEVLTTPSPGEMPVARRAGLVDAAAATDLAAAARWVASRSGPSVVE